MDRLFGRTLCPLTPDGRLRLPVGPGCVAAGETVVLTRGAEPCVRIYPLDAWARLEARMDRLSRMEPEERGQLRTLNMWAEEAPVSDAWEVVVPAPLRTFASLGEVAEVVGRGEWMEVWGLGHCSGQLLDAPR